MSACFALCRISVGACVLVAAATLALSPARAEGDAGLAGDRLMAASTALYGRVFIGTPSAEEMLHTSGRPAGKVVFYQPDGQGGAWKVTLPVEADGYYRLIGTHVRVRNPAFDVTPAELITALITERGIVQPVDTAGIRQLFA